MQDLISVIVPIYNVEKYLKRCINSILYQTYRNLEIILIDDGSTDSCGNICDDYLKIDSRIIVHHKKNGGLSDARNIGISLSKGKYIFFIDSDDYIELNAIEILHSFAERENTEILNFEAYNENENEELIDTRYYVKQNVYTGIYSGNTYFVQQYLCGDYRSPVQYYFFKRDYLVKQGLNFHFGILHEDEEFTLRALLNAERVMHIPCILYHHTIRNDSIMGRRKTQKNIDSIYEIIVYFISVSSEYMDSDYRKIAYIYAVKHLIQCFFSCCYDSSEGISFSLLKKMYRIIGKSNDDCKFAKRFILECLYGRWLEKHLIISKVTRMIKRIEDVFVFIYNVVFFPLGDCSKSLLLLAKTKRNNNRIVVLCVHHNHGNRGDLAITLAQKKYLERNVPDRIIVEIPTVLCEKHYKLIGFFITSNDVVMISGGGWFGSFWRHNELAAQNVIRKYINNRIIIFPQTVFYSDDAIGMNQMSQDRAFFSRFNDLHVCVRDKGSLDFINENNIFGYSAEVVHTPDIVLTYNPHLDLPREDLISICLRKDVEQIIDYKVQNHIVLDSLRNAQRVIFISNNHSNKPVRFSEREVAVMEQLEEVSRCKLVITDRLHSMIFAAITGTPCIAMDNKTGKVKGVYSWLEDIPYISFVDNDENIDIEIKSKGSANHFWDESIYEKYFDRIRELIEE